MKIIQHVLIKQIITEDSKSKLRNTFNEYKVQLEQECQQLLFEQKRLESKKGISKQEVSIRFQKEIKQRKEEIHMTEFKLEQLDMLKIGSEIVEDEVEALVEVSEGMHWSHFKNEKSIVIKDGIVVRIDD